MKLLIGSRRPMYVTKLSSAFQQIRANTVITDSSDGKVYAQKESTVVETSFPRC